MCPRSHSLNGPPAPPTVTASCRPGAARPGVRPRGERTAVPAAAGLGAEACTLPGGMVAAAHLPTFLLRPTKTTLPPSLMN